MGLLAPSNGLSHQLASRKLPSLTAAYPAIVTKITAYHHDLQLQSAAII